MCGCKVFLLNKTSQVGPKVLNVLEASRPEDIFATTTPPKGKDYNQT